MKPIGGLESEFLSRAVDHQGGRFDLRRGLSGHVVGGAPQSSNPPSSRNERSTRPEGFAQKHIKAFLGVWKCKYSFLAAPPMRLLAPDLDQRHRQILVILSTLVDFCKGLYRLLHISDF